MGRSEEELSGVEHCAYNRGKSCRVLQQQNDIAVKVGVVKVCGRMTYKLLQLIRLANIG